MAPCDKLWGYFFFAYKSEQTEFVHKEQANISHYMKKPWNICQKKKLNDKFHGRFFHDLNEFHKTVMKYENKTLELFSCHR